MVERDLEQANPQAAVITVSDRAASGERADAAGPVAVTALRDAGFACQDATIVADGVDSVETALREALDGGVRLIVTSGGTGIGPRDVTPAATRRVVEVELPGIPEALRQAVIERLPTAALSRGIAGVAAGALIVNLPGSPKAVDEGIRFICSIAHHALDQLAGVDHS